jgi:hypothetical protein
MFDQSEWDLAASDPVARMHAALVDLGGEDHDHWHAGTLSTQMVALLEVRERLDAELARLAARWQQRRGWEADGALSPVAWLTHRAPVSAPEARRVMKTAKVLTTAPHVAEALHHGDTTTAHVQALAQVMSPRRQGLLGDHDQVLAKQATRLDVNDFTLLVRRWAAIADDHLAGDDHEEHRPRNELQAAVTMDGWVDGRFRLDPVAGAELLGTLDHLAPPDPTHVPDGARTLTQRRGDALAELANWYHRGAVPGGNPPNLDVVVDVATLNDQPPPLVKARCDLEGVGPVTRATLEQLSCDATVTRVVMAGDSVILDMGRRTRLATPAQTRAVRIRDAGCVFPSCDRPAPWCDIHHINWFGKGGTTDVATMCLLCRRHHTLIHNSRWTIRTKPDGTFTITHPTRAP